MKTKSTPWMLASVITPPPPGFATWQAHWDHLMETELIPEAQRRNEAFWEREIAEQKARREAQEDHLQDPVEDLPSPAAPPLNVSFLTRVRAWLGRRTAR